MPRPKWYCQMRLTITRAVSGLSFDAIQSARTVRRPLVLAPVAGVGVTALPGVMTARRPGSTLAPGEWALPRTMADVAGAAGRRSVTHSAVGRVAFVRRSRSRFRLARYMR